MIEEYERKVGTMSRSLLQECGQYLQQARDMETLYFQDLLDLADSLGGVQTDGLLNIISKCHDAHQKVMDKRIEL